MRRKSLTKFILSIYFLSTIVSYTAIAKSGMLQGSARESGQEIATEETGNEARDEERDEERNEGHNIVARAADLSPTGFGIMCLSAAYPGIDTTDISAISGKGMDESGVTKTGTQGKNDLQGTPGSGTESSKIPVVANDAEENTEPRVFGKDPVVLIVHTHATESYLPSSEGNYHRKGRLNTVRDAGDVLAETLKEAGIPCIHDSTLHDEKSYNQAYARSYETIQKLLKKYPSIECVIDLHRDAIPGSSKAATVSIKGKTCAKYSYVVSNAVPTYDSNLKFVKALNKRAEKDFAGFTGAVLERGYRYNQDLSSKYMLLEVGYNRNDITEVRNTAQLFGEILAETLKSEG